MPNLKQLLHNVLPPGSAVISGESGLYNEVSWVISLRPIPPGIASLAGNEFALLGTDVASGLGLTIGYLISSLAERGVSGIGILGEVTLNDYQEAQIRNIPVVKLPAQTDISSLETVIIRFISEERQILYQKEREFSQAFMALAVNGSGTNEILAKITELTGRQVGILDKYQKPHKFTSQEIEDRIQHVVKLNQTRLINNQSSNAAPIIGVTLTKNEAAFIGAIRVGIETVGYLTLIVPEKELSEIDRLAVRLGCLALAVEMSRRQAIQDTEERFEVDIINNFLTGELSTRDQEEIAKRLHIDFNLPYISLMLHMPGLRLNQTSILRVVNGLFPESNFYSTGDDLAILFPLEHPLSVVELRKWGRRIYSILASHFTEKITLGIGRTYYGAEGIRTSYRESQQALAMGTRLFGAGSITSFGDLGVYRLLFSLKTSGEIAAFYKEYLGKLVEYDQKHDGELIRTLKAYLSYAAVAETARAIHVHRNTLLYRLARIQDITGADLEDGETRLTLHLAILAGEVNRVE